MKKNHDKKAFRKLLKRHQKPLPWEHPKPNEDDPKAHKRVKAIMAHDNFIQADRDPNFLRRDEVRGVRLEVDYFKPELLLREHGIEHTIVVFGSTRIMEEAEAKRLIESLESERNAKDGEALEKELGIARRILAKSHYYETARAFGRIVGRSGKGPEDTKITLMTGGGPGIMEAANRGAFDVGAKSIGLNITLPHEQYPNPYITPELCFQVHYFAIRKLHFLRRAKALVIFPGGYGTLDECFEVLTLVQTRKIDPMPVVFVGESYWRGIINFEMLVEEGTIDEEDRELFAFAETAEEAWEAIVKWHKKCGSTLIHDLKK
ncbi:TIGR00730 family Rossman fold protein [Sulfurimonas sp. HSL-3221]|uniref:LOG family protein n=1 Tax=Sulfurimonadaceae TaxID=2771471 RepID=UPI001E4700D5|nr:TIGR00730 family Rossman fold protein [Sulfurimonas sp. HSL-3221]UFS62841.1 TIGR00730 family Rossman fold protein [Sulfurimonas sp. HSL-3221]